MKKFEQFQVLGDFLGKAKTYLSSVSYLFAIQGDNGLLKKSQYVQIRAKLTLDICPIWIGK